MLADDAHGVGLHIEVAPEVHLWLSVGGDDLLITITLLVVLISENQLWHGRGRSLLLTKQLLLCFFLFDRNFSK